MGAEYALFHLKSFVSETLAEIFVEAVSLVRLACVHKAWAVAFSAIGVECEL